MEPDEGEGIEDHVMAALRMIGHVFWNKAGPGRNPQHRMGGEVEGGGVEVDGLPDINEDAYYDYSAQELKIHYKKKRDTLASIGEMCRQIDAKRMNKLQKEREDD